jgi:membrane-associated phospholipid phosphatase
MTRVRLWLHDRAGGGFATASSPFGDERVARRCWMIVAFGFALVVGFGVAAWHGGPTRVDSFDRGLGSVFYTHPGQAVRRVFDVITLLGEPAAVWVAAFVIGALVWRRWRTPLIAAFCPVVVLVSATVEKSLKYVVARSRPPTALFVHESGFSFPSGHATAAASLAFALMFLSVTCGWRRRPGAVALLTCYTALVAASRLVLGVHYASDVIAANALTGALTLALGWLFTSPPNNQLRPVRVTDRQR